MAVEMSSVARVNLRPNVVTRKPISNGEQMPKTIIVNNKNDGNKKV